MSRPHLFSKPAPADDPRPAHGPGATAAEAPEEAGPTRGPGPAVADPKHATTRSKLAEGARGIKLAIRAESGFFAHAYRGLLIGLTAAILGISATGWCFLVVSAALVLVAETFRCAINAALDAVGEPGDPRSRVAREIATGGLLFASITSACITIMVLSARLGAMLGW